MINTRTLLALTATAGLFGASAVASAANEIKIDLNDFTVTSLDNDNDGVVDGLSFGTDGDTAVTEILIDGMPVETFTTSVNFSGELMLDGTTVTGGQLILADLDGNVFNVANVGGSIVSIGNAFDLALFMTGVGDFNSDVFEGVDVSDFNDNEPLNVSILGFDFANELLSTVGFVDDESSFEFLTVIPSPTAATAGLGLMGVLALGKRRKA